MNYVVGINMTRLRSVSVETDIIDGVPVKCLRIPIRENFMVEHHNGDVYMDVIMSKLKNVSRQKGSHILSIDTPREEYKRLKKQASAPHKIVVGYAWPLVTRINHNTDD